MKIQLTKPINAFGEMVSELEFTEPSFGVLKKCAPHKSIEEEYIGKMIEFTCNIPTSSVDQISIADIESISEVIGNFLSTSTKKSRVVSTP